MCKILETEVNSLYTWTPFVSDRLQVAPHSLTNLSTFSINLLTALHVSGCICPTETGVHILPLPLATCLSLGFRLVSSVTTAL